MLLVPYSEGIIFRLARQIVKACRARSCSVCVWLLATLPATGRVNNTSTKGQSAHKILARDVMNVGLCDLERRCGTGACGWKGNRARGAIGCNVVRLLR